MTWFFSAERQAVPIDGPGTIILASDAGAQLDGSRLWLDASSCAVVAH